MPRNTGELQETGDRWKLDILIPARDRIYTGDQYDKQSLGIMSISKPMVASRPVLNRVRGIDPTRRYHTPIYSHAETMMEYQRRLRCGDVAQPGDRLE